MAKNPYKTIAVLIDYEIKEAYEPEENQFGVPDYSEISEEEAERINSSDVEATFESFKTKYLGTRIIEKIELGNTWIIEPDGRKFFMIKEKALYSPDYPHARILIGRIKDHTIDEEYTVYVYQELK